MKNELCELCGYESQLGDIKKFPIIPSEIARQAGILRSKNVRLCFNCHEELNQWYLRAVADMTYDASIKRFKPRSLQETAKEYERAYRRFARYKKEYQQKN
jgi:hypothetical protein